MKRTNKEIELDVKAIQEAANSATTLKEIAEITGLTCRKVTTSLARHPIIRKRVIATLEANKTSSKSTPSNLPHPRDKEGKWIVICDCPALVYGLNSCTATRVVIPHFVAENLERMSTFPSREGKMACNTLSVMNVLHNWCTIAPEFEGKLLVEPSNSKDFSWRAKAIVALACKYQSEGYSVTLKTRTAEIYKLAAIQGCLALDFVPADNELKIS